MTHSVEYRPGEIFALRGSMYDLIIEQANGRLSLVRHFAVGKSKRQEIRLDRLQSIEIEADDSPALGVRGAGEILKGAKAAAKGAGTPGPETLTGELPRSLHLLLLARDERGKVEPTDMRLSVEGVTDRRTVVEFAFKVAAAAGLARGSVYAIPQAGLEVRLASDGGPDPGLPYLPRLEGPELGRIASEALSNAGLPPFNPMRFRSDHQVRQWLPGERVIFRRPLSWASLFLFPFALLVLAGPALYLASLFLGGSVDPIALGAVTVVGLLLGGTATLFLMFLLPRSVSLDWSKRVLGVTTWFRSRKVLFDEIERLELVAKRHESSGGESGSHRITFVCELRARQRGPGKRSASVELVSTLFMNRIDEPLRQGFPLMQELAAALGVEGRYVDYDFRQG